MAISTSHPADTTAERIVRHFQAAGFPGVTEALLVRIRLKKGDRLALEAAFDLAQDRDATPPVHEYFEIRVHGFYSDVRAVAQAKAAFTDDFGRGLAFKLPQVYFDAAPVVADDALATGTRYDAMLKLGNNTNELAVAVLLNDPTSSFFEYLESQVDYDWQHLMGELDAATTTLVADEDVLRFL